MRKYYLDANICIFYLRKPHGALAEKIASFRKDEIKIPAIVKAELLVGAVKSNKPHENIFQVLDFCRSFEIIPFDDSAAMFYAEIRADLERKGQKIGPNDLLIAATVLSHDGILVTHNTEEFSRIDNLKLEDWTRG